MDNAQDKYTTSDRDVSELTPEETQREFTMFETLINSSGYQLLHRNWQQKKDLCIATLCDPNFTLDTPASIVAMQTTVIELRFADAQLSLVPDRWKELKQALEDNEREARKQNTPE